MKKNIITACLLGAVLAGTSFLPTMAEAAEETVAETVEAAEAKEPVLYVSEDYHFSILCPQKPALVIAADDLYPEKAGEILIFDYEDNNIKHAWAILKNGFQDKDIPDLNLMPESDAQNLMRLIKESQGYETIQLVNITTTNKGIFAVTGKDLEFDTDGDGVVDFTAHADNQIAVTFFRGNLGGRYAIRLLDNPDLRESSVKEYQIGVASFHELDEKEIETINSKVRG